MRKLLSAYLEGTLSQEKKLYVARRLQQSVVWQREFNLLRNMRRELKNEMPLMGRSGDTRLAALLPDILHDARTEQFDVGAFLKRVVMGSMLLLILLVFPTLFVQLSGPAHAAISRVENVPSVTNTPATEVDVTAEARQVPSSQVSFVRFASPVPMPGPTLEASLEARNNNRQ